MQFSAGHHKADLPLEFFLETIYGRTCHWLLRNKIMKRILFRFSCLMFLSALNTHATINVLNYWRMGENDPGAAAGGTSMTTIDSVGGNNLNNSPFIVNGLYYFYPTYSGSVSPAAASDVASTLALQYINDEYASGNVIPGLTNNFGIELWVCPVSENNGFIAYNGNTTGNGWGLFQSGGNCFGSLGANTFGMTPLATNIWTHLALVCNNGTTTLYTNGAVAAATNSLAVSPAGAFLLAADNNGQENFSGLLDEVRVFTFAPGQFSTNDLLVNQSPYTLGTKSLVEGPQPGTDSLTLNLVISGAVWTASANASWLHLLTATGNTSTNLVFSFDANTGSTRTGTFTVAGQNVTFIQAGSTYIPAGVATLVASGLNQPYGVAIDAAGNVYISDSHNNAIKEWHFPAGNVTTNVSTGLSGPTGVAVDSAGNVYFADTGKNAIKEWHFPAGNVTTNVPTGLNGPTGVAVDGAGNVYFADTGNNAIKEWHASAGNVTTNVSSGLSGPTGVAVDGAGDIYIADSGNHAVKEWDASGGSIISLVSFGLNRPSGVAVDGSGNVFISQTNNNAIEEWHAAAGTFTTNVPAGSNTPAGVAVDDAGNLYISVTSSNAVKELPRVYVDAAPRFEGSNAGNDALSAVVPTTANLSGPFTPGSDAAWLTISGVTNGVVRVNFTANTGTTNRTADITLLGQKNPLVQFATFGLGTASIVEGPRSGVDSVVLASTTISNAWTATANASWLHLATGYLSGTGSTNILFSFDANTDVTRSGTISIGNQTLTVTQAGSTYAAVGPQTLLPMTTGLPGSSSGLAVDLSGDVYAPDYFGSSCQKWVPGASASSGISNTLSGNYIKPSSLAVESSGALFVFDAPNQAIEQWTTNTGAATLLAKGSFGLATNHFGQLAVDVVGNVYFADTANAAIDQWVAVSNAFTTLVSNGLSKPLGVAVDLAGNLYIADTNNNAIEKWNAANGALTTLVSGLNQPVAVAVDGSGNVFIANAGDDSLKEWTAAAGNLSTLVSGLTGIEGVAVDKLDNLYYSQSTSGNSYSELPRAFVDASIQQVSGPAGTNSLPTVLPASESLLLPFAPVNPFQSTGTSNWLFNTNITAAGGVVSFSYGANTTGTARTNYISLLGTNIVIVQDYVQAVPPRLIGVGLLAGGGRIQFSFTNYPGATFSVLTSTNIDLPPAEWTRLGAATNLGSGQFQFAAPATNGQQYYRVSSP